MPVGQEAPGRGTGRCYVGPMGETFDYVIVGAGSAGCILAARLTEDPGTTVLLLEAGPDWRSKEAGPEVRSLNPGLVLDNPALADLQYPTLVATRTPGQERSVLWRGRGVGGSSTVNGVLAIRALPGDHDGWGLPGWGWDDVLPLYRRLETDHDFGAEAYHGADGPLPIFRMPRDEWGPVDRAIAAAAEPGYGWCDDHNAPTGSGVSPYAINGDPATRTRVTLNDAYLEPARDRLNLTVWGDVLVDRVVVAGGRAVGVRAQVEGEWRTIEAGEVLLCAGAVHSPAVLLRSGIGPGLGVASLPVGLHLQDHPLCAVGVPLREEARSASTARHTNVCVRYSSGLAGADDNDMMIVGMNLTPMGPFGLIGAWVNQCWSRGTLRLASPDPSEHPVIDEHMLTDERDLVRMRDAVRRLAELVASPAVTALTDAPVFDFSGQPFELPSTDAALDAWILALARDAQHICGTARMGTGDDSVVDANCRVHGVDGLRVIDASVFPTVPRANTHLMVLAVAERMADVLRGR